MPVQLRTRITVVRTRPAVFAGPACVPATVYLRRQAAAAVVVVFTVLVLALGGLLASSGGGDAAVPDGAGEPAAVYVVQPGDTLWEIACRLSPGEDPRALVARLVAAHGSPALVAGERLSLPAAG